MGGAGSGPPATLWPCSHPATELMCTKHSPGCGGHTGAVPASVKACGGTGPSRTQEASGAESGLWGALGAAASFGAGWAPLGAQEVLPARPAPYQKEHAMRVTDADP